MACKLQCQKAHVTSSNREGAIRLEAKRRISQIPAAGVPREVPIVLGQNFLLERGSPQESYLDSS